MTRIESSRSAVPFAPPTALGFALPPAQTPAPRASAFTDGLESVVVEADEASAHLDVPGLPGDPTVPARPLTPREQRFLESTQTPNFGPVNRIYDPTIDDKITRLEQFVTERGERYLQQFNAAADDKMRLFYADLYIAMLGDQGDLAGWQSRPHAEKADLYNRLIKEVNLEIRHNVAVMKGSGKQWTEEDLDQLDAGLRAAGTQITLEGELRFMVKESQLVDTQGDATTAAYEGGVIRFSDLASGDPTDSRKPNRIQSSLLHQIGLAKTPWGPYMDRLMADSGWIHVGEQGAPALAGFNHGQWATAAQLKACGVNLEGASDDQYFKISKKFGHAFIVPAQAPPDISTKQVSRLAAESPWEDFAETYRLFCQDPSGLRASFPDKYELLLELREIGLI